jgi:hypothetical protein
VASAWRKAHAFHRCPGVPEGVRCRCAGGEVVAAHPRLREGDVPKAFQPMDFVIAFGAIVMVRLFGILCLFVGCLQAHVPRFEVTIEGVARYPSAKGRLV